MCQVLARSAKCCVQQNCCLFFVASHASLQGYATRTSQEKMETDTKIFLYIAYIKLTVG